MITPLPKGPSAVAVVEQEHVARYAQILARLALRKLWRETAKYAPLKAAESQIQVVGWAIGHFAAHLLTAGFVGIATQEQEYQKAVAALKAAGADPNQAAGIGAPPNASMDWMATVLNAATEGIRKATGRPVRLGLMVEQGRRPGNGRIVVP